MEIDDIWSDDEDREQFSRPTDPQPQEPAGCGPNMKGMESHGPDYVAMLEPMLSCGPSLESASDLITRLRDTPNWKRETWGGDWKSTCLVFDRAPFEAADTIAALTKEREMSFDEQPDGDLHGECAAEIHRLEQLCDELVAALRIIATTAGSAAHHRIAQQVLEKVKPT